MKRRIVRRLLTLGITASVMSLASVAYAQEPEEPVPTFVVNSTPDPIPVQDVRTYPIQRFVHGEFLYWGAVEEIYTVPLDKRLVIEYFSCVSRDFAFDTSYSCYIQTRLNSDDRPDGITHYLPVTPYGHSEKRKNAGAQISAGQRVQIYADPGTKVLVGAFRNMKKKLDPFTPAPDSMNFSLSGYAVDVAP